MGAPAVQMDHESTGAGESLGDPMVAALLAASQESKASAKWITAAFAAVGAALITGLSLSDLGELSTFHLVVASVGATLGIFGVLLVIIFATRVLASRFIVLTEFTEIDGTERMLTKHVLHPAPTQQRQLEWVLDRLERNKSLATRQGESVTEFIDWLDEWEGAQVSARRNVLRAEARHAKAEVDLPPAQQHHEELAKNKPGAKETQAAGKALEDRRQDLEDAQRELKDAQHKLKEARSEVGEFRRLAERLRAVAQYEYVTVRFDTSRFWIVASAFVASIGVLMFAIATAAS